MHTLNNFQVLHSLEELCIRESAQPPGRGKHIFCHTAGIEIWLTLCKSDILLLNQRQTQRKRRDFNAYASICIYIYISSSSCHATARISLTLSLHFSQSFFASGKSSGLHPISSHSCCMYVRAGRPAFAWPYVGVHRSTSLMSLSLLLQLCPACLVRLAWIVFVMGGR